MHQRQQNLLVDLALGAAAGAAATWVMDRVTTFLYERESEAARKRENEARGGQTAYVAAADRLAGAVGQSLSDQEQKQAGNALHWGLGMAAGALYGAVRPHLSGLGSARGAVFGTAFFLLMDEGAIPLAGLTPGPTHFPWQTHARGLAGHLAFGLTADALLATADQVA